MAVLSVQTKKIQELPQTSDIGLNDLIIVELTEGGSRKMTYADLLSIVRQNLIKGSETEEGFLTLANISEIQTEDGTKVPASALIKEMNDLATVMYREKMAPYGYFGIEHSLSDLMTMVRAEQWDKFAIGDYFIDTRTTGEQVIWEVAGKNDYLHCGDQGNGLDVPHIICIPRDCITETHAYNTTNVNTGGYAASLMPAYLETILTTFSTALRNCVTSVRRLENNKGGWAWASRSIALPSTLEILGHQGWADQYSGGPVCHSLPLFTGGNAHVMKGRGFNKSAATRMWYWLADPVASNTTGFCDVSGRGYSSDAGASDARGLAPLIVLS